MAGGGGLDNWTRAWGHIVVQPIREDKGVALLILQASVSGLVFRAPSGRSCERSVSLPLQGTIRCIRGCYRGSMPKATKLRKKASSTYASGSSLAFNLPPLL